MGKPFIIFRRLCGLSLVPNGKPLWGSAYFPPEASVRSAYLYPYSTSSCIIISYSTIQNPRRNALRIILQTWLRHPDGAMLGALNKGPTTASRGGICGHLGGDFSYHSADALRLAPHIEKMLYNTDATNFYARSNWGSDNQHRR